MNELFLLEPYTSELPIHSFVGSPSIIREKVISVLLLYFRFLLLVSYYPSNFLLLHSVSDAFQSVFLILIRISGIVFM